MGVLKAKVKEFLKYPTKRLPNGTFDLMGLHRTMLRW